MKKADRPHAWGGTYRDRAAGSGWMNWWIVRGRLSQKTDYPTWRKQMRSISWRRVL